MFTSSVNWLGVIGAAIVSFIIGFLWYGPLFGKQWMKLSKISALDISKNKQKGMAKPATLNFLGNIMLASVFAQVLNLVGVSTIGQGIIFGFWIWLGFFASATLLNTVLWEGKPWSLYVLNGLYWLINLGIIGALLSVWS